MRYTYQSLDVNHARSHGLNCLLGLADIFLWLQVVKVSTKANDMSVSSWGGAITDGIGEFVEWIRNSCPGPHVFPGRLRMDLYTLVDMSDVRCRCAGRVKRRIKCDGVEHIQWNRGYQSSTCVLAAISSGQGHIIAVVLNRLHRAVEYVGQIARRETLLEEPNCKARLSSLELV